jgi:hypothetical protein
MPDSYVITYLGVCHGTKGQYAVGSDSIERFGLGSKAEPASHVLQPTTGPVFIESPFPLETQAAIFRRQRV